MIGRDGFIQAYDAQAAVDGSCQVEGHSGDELTAAGQGVWPIAVPTMFGLATVTPKAGMQFVHLHEGGFSETGANGFDLSSVARTTDSFQPYLGIAAAQTFVTQGGVEITPELRLGYNREVLSNSRVLTVAAMDGSRFLVQGVKPTRDMMSAGAGITVRAHDNMFLYANYYAVVHTGNTTDQSISAGLRIRF